MKAYAIIAISGDLAYMGNVLIDGSIIWLAGTLIGITTHSVKILYGRGAPPRLDADDFKINLQSIYRTIGSTILYACGLLTLSYWKELCAVLAQFNGPYVLEKLKRSILFWRYPLDAGWFMFFIAGTLYAIDSANIFGLRAEMSWAQVVLGVFIACGALVAFLTDRNDLAGRIFAISTISNFVAAIVDANIALLIAGFFFLYYNYLIGKVDSKHQSDFTTSEQMARAKSV